MTSTTWPVYSPFAREHYGRGLEEGQTKGRAEGKAEGKAEVVIRILVARGFTVPDELKAKIGSIADMAALNTLIERAVICDGPGSLLL